MLHTSLNRLALSCVLGFSFCAAQAATPASGTITPDERVVETTGGPFVIPNVTSQTEVVDALGAPLCMPTPGAQLICDVFDLTLDLPADFFTTNPNDMVSFTMTWDAATGQEDYDFFLLDAAGEIVSQGEGTTNPEVMRICAGQGQQNYQVQIIPWNALAATYTMKIEMVSATRSNCKAPKSAGSAVADKAAAPGNFAGALNLGLLLPLFGLMRWRKALR